MGAAVGEVLQNPQGQYHRSLQKTGDRLLESRSSRATLNITHCWVTEQTECKRATHHRWKQPAWAGKEIQKSAARGLLLERSSYPQQMHGHKMHSHTMHGSIVVGSTRTIASAGVGSEISLLRFLGSCMSCCRSWLFEKTQAFGEKLPHCINMTYGIKDEKKTIHILYTIIMAPSLASCELTTSPAVTAPTTHE
jgi:hypothetical protein